MADFFTNWLSVALGGADVSGLDLSQPMQLTTEQATELLKRRQEALRIAADYRKSDMRNYAEARARDLKNEIDTFKAVEGLQAEIEMARQADQTKRLEIASRAQTEALTLANKYRESMAPDEAFLQRATVGPGNELGMLTRFFGEGITGSEEGMRIPPAKQYASALYLIREAGGTIDENGRVVVPDRVQVGSTLYTRMQDYVDSAAQQKALIDAKIANAESLEQKARDTISAINREATPEEAERAYEELALAGANLRRSVDLAPGTVDEYAEARRELAEEDEMLAQLDEQVALVDKYMAQDEGLEGKVKRALGNESFRRWAESYGFDIGRVGDDGSLLTGRDTTKAILLYGYQDKMGRRFPGQRRRTGRIPLVGTEGGRFPGQRRQTGRTLLVETEGTPGTQFEVAEFAVGDKTMRLWKLTQPDGSVVYADTGENDGDPKVMSADQLPPEALAALTFAPTTPDEDASLYFASQGLNRAGKMGSAVEYRELTLRPEDLADGTIRAVNLETGEVVRLPRETKFTVIDEPDDTPGVDKREARMAARLGAKRERAEGLEDRDGSTAQRRAAERRLAAEERVEEIAWGIEDEDRLADLEGEIEGLELTRGNMPGDLPAAARIDAAIKQRREQVNALKLRRDQAQTAEDRLEARTQELGDVGKTPRQLKKQARKAAAFDYLGEETAADIEGRPSPTTIGSREQMSRIGGRMKRITEKVASQGGKMTGVQAMRLQKLAKKYGVLDAHVNPAERPEIPEGQRLATPPMAMAAPSAEHDDPEAPVGIGSLPRMEIPSKHTPPKQSERVFTPVSADGDDEKAEEAEETVDQDAAAREAALEAMRKKRDKKKSDEDGEETP